MTIEREHLDRIDFSDVVEGNDLMPPVTPGEILREDFMGPLGLSANALAKALHVPPNRITAILNGNRSITADTALRLARYFNTTPHSWLNLQKNYELEVAKRTVGRTVETEVEPYAGSRPEDARPSGRVVTAQRPGVGSNPPSGACHCER